MDTEALIDQLPGASESLKALARCGVARVYSKGRILIEEGDLGDALFVILQGRLRAYASDAEKGREITFGSYGPGEYVGEMSLDGGPRSASVATTERSVCVVVARRTLEAHIAEHPDFAFELLAKVIRRARAATLSARQMALNDTYGRLRLLLESLAIGPPTGPRTLSEALTHRDLAWRIGSSREMVSRILADLERAGVVTGGGHEGKPLVLLKTVPAKW